MANAVPQNDRGYRAAVLQRSLARAIWTVAFGSLATATSGLAGPPYVTDDPEPAAAGTLETYLFSDGAMAGARLDDASTGLEVNYGALPGVQLSGALALDYGSNEDLRVGATEIGVKYRFIEENAWRPQISFYPQAEFAVRHSVGEDDAPRYLLPVWAQKSLGDWTVFGGGGYRINPGADRTDSWLGGFAVERPVATGLAAGAEIYGETRTAADEPGLWGLGFGLTWELDEAFALLGSAGPVFEGDRTEFAYYLALGWHS
jgi:hypothetical protein